MSSASRTTSLLRSLGKICERLSSSVAAEDVHHLRTTVRRIEALLTAAGTSDSGKAPKIRKQLAKLRRRAGAVRDLDVQITALQGVRSETAAAEKKLVLRHLREERVEAAQRLARKVEKATAHDLRKNIQRLAAELAPAEIASTTTVRSVCPDHDWLGVALDEFAARSAKWGERPSEQSMHALRLACKRIRYTAEIADNNPQTRKAVAEFKRMQDAMGDWHDWQTLAQTIDEVLPADEGTALRALVRARAKSKYLAAVRVVSETRSRLLAMRETPSVRKTPHGTRNAIAQSATGA